MVFNSYIPSVVLSQWQEVAAYKYPPTFCIIVQVTEIHKPHLELILKLNNNKVQEISDGK